MVCDDPEEWDAGEGMRGRLKRDAGPQHRPTVRAFLRESCLFSGVSGQAILSTLPRKPGGWAPFHHSAGSAVQRAGVCGLGGPATQAASLLHLRHCSVVKPREKSFHENWWQSCGNLKMKGWPPWSDPPWSQAQVSLAVGVVLASQTRHSHLDKDNPLEKSSC